MKHGVILTVFCMEAPTVLYLVCSKHYTGVIEYDERVADNGCIDMCTALTMQSVSRPGYWE
jgi:hypothetical protein